MGLGEVEECPSQELEGIGELGIIGIVSRFGLIDDELRFGNV